VASSKLKVLQVIQKPQRRGAEMFACQLGQELLRQRHDVCIVCLYPASGAEGLPITLSHRLFNGQENHPLERVPGFQPSLLSRLGSLIREFQPEIVQANGGRTVKYGALCSLLQPRRSWALIYRNIGEPGQWVRGRARQLYYRGLVIPRIDGVVGVSEATMRAVKDFYRLSIPTAQIPNGVDPAALEPARTRDALRRRVDTPAEAPVLLSVGSLSHEKRVDRLLRLTRRIVEVQPQAHLWLVGDGPLRAELERQAEDLGVAGQTRFFGAQADVASYMNAADLFILSSDTEGIPAVVLEAGWLGLPVVATRVGGLPECVLDGETGLLVDPVDEAALAQAVAGLLKDPLLRAEMGDRARAWVESRFTMDAIARRYVDFYRQVLDRAHATPV
jgi:glycosyltransferase involved in cell wall biosynthesis